MCQLQFWDKIWKHQALKTLIKVFPSILSYQSFDFFKISVPNLSWKSSSYVVKLSRKKSSKFFFHSLKPSSKWSCPLLSSRPISIAATTNCIVCLFYVRSWYCCGILLIIFKNISGWTLCFGELHCRKNDEKTQGYVAIHLDTSYLCRQYLIQLCAIQWSSSN